MTDEPVNNEPQTEVKPNVIAAYAGVDATFQLEQDKALWRIVAYPRKEEAQPLVIYADVFQGDTRRAWRRIVAGLIGGGR